MQFAFGRAFEIRQAARWLHCGCRVPLGGRSFNARILGSLGCVCKHRKAGVSNYQLVLRQDALECSSMQQPKQPMVIWEA